MKINKSAARVADILEYIANSDEPLGITDISKHLDIPKSSTFDILYTLVEKGFLEIADEKHRTFKLGLKLFTIGSSFLRKADLIQIARPFLEKVMEKTGDTVFLGVQNGKEIVYLDKVESASAGIRTTATLGFRNPMHCTALGKAILATYSKKKVKDILGEEPLITKTAYSIDNYEQLFQDLDNTRKRGYAVDIRESQEEICCVAAPIYDYSNKAIAAISIASLAYKLNEDMRSERGKMIAETAIKVSSRFGFISNKLFF